MWYVCLNVFFVNRVDSEASTTKKELKIVCVCVSDDKWEHGPLRF